MNKTLIAYGSWTGATRTVAEAIAKELETAGLQVEVRRAKEVRDLSPHSAVAVGISVHSTCRYSAAAWELLGSTPAPGGRLTLGG